MAPPAGFDTEQIRDKARKDLLYLLSVVSQVLFHVLTMGTQAQGSGSWTSFIDPARLPA